MVEEELNNKIIFYSGSSIDIFRNLRLVTDINRSNHVIHIYASVGSKMTQAHVMVPDYGKLWYDDNTIDNIFALINLFKKYRVPYDSDQYDDFVIHTNIGIIKFRRNKQGQYAFKPAYTTENFNVFTRVEENMFGFTSRQIERVKLAT